MVQTYVFVWDVRVCLAHFGTYVFAEVFAFWDVRVCFLGRTCLLLGPTCSLGTYDFGTCFSKFCSYTYMFILLHLACHSMSNTQLDVTKSIRSKNSATSFRVFIFSPRAIKTLRHVTCLYYYVMLFISFS